MQEIPLVQLLQITPEQMADFEVDKLNMSMHGVSLGFDPNGFRHYAQDGKTSFVDPTEPKVVELMDLPTTFSDKGFTEALKTADLAGNDSFAE